jgi:hypothetical protein
MRRRSQGNTFGEPSRYLRSWLVTSLAGVALAACDTSENTRKEEQAAPQPQFIVESPAGYFELLVANGQCNIVTPDSDDACFRLNGALITFGDAAQVGTGNLNPFLQLQGSGQESEDDTSAETERGFNTSGTAEIEVGSSPNFNKDLPLSQVPVIKLADGVLYREIVLDANESNSEGTPPYSIDVMEVWLMSSGLGGPDDFDSPDSYADVVNGGVMVWDMVVGGDAKVIRTTDAFSKGSGNRSDLQFFIPNSAFETAAGQAAIQGCPYAGPEAEACGLWVVVFAKMGYDGGTYIVHSGFEEYATVERGFVTVEKTATATFDRKYKWKISKTADPTAASIFDGDEQDVDYVVKVEPDGFEDINFEISGSITVTNPGTEAVSIFKPTDELKGTGLSANPAVDCGSAVFDVLTGYSIPAKGNLVCTYSYTVAGTLPQDANNTASVELVDGAVVQKTVAVTVAGEPADEIDESYTLSDSIEGDLGAGGLPSGTTDSYTNTLTCEANEGETKNTATFTTDDTQTTGTADATVTLTCYDLTVTKDATADYKRSYAWKIDKDADPAFGDSPNLQLASGETYEFHYKVVVDTTGHTDSDFAGSGKITVKNNHPSKSAFLTGVADVVAGPVNATVVCNVTFPYELVANGTLECTYTVSLTSTTDKLNTATATQQNKHYDTDGTILGNSGTTDYSGTATIDFNGPTSEVDECIDVGDDKYGALGTVCVGVPAGVPPKTFNYALTIGPFEACGPYTYTNTAAFETNDTETTGSDSYTVNITVPCAGCTLTQGYWKTHNATFKALKGGKGPPADDNWLNVTPFAEQSGFFTVANAGLGLTGPNTPSPTASGTPTTAFDWYLVFWTPPGGNAFYNLAHQYMAAKLNVLNGVTPAANVATAITYAETFFATAGNTPAAVALLKGGAKNTIINNAGILGSFNEGAAGTSHCSEDFLARSTR